MLLHGWAGSTRGSQKVTHFVVFLKPQGIGDMGTLRSSIWQVAARFVNLNSKIPSLSDGA